VEQRIVFIKRVPLRFDAMSRRGKQPNTSSKRQYDEKNLYFRELSGNELPFDDTIN
jgi:hypothetical protein